VNVDLRIFDYSLEPLRRLRQWQLDALHARLARMQRQIDQAQRAQVELCAERDKQSQELVQALTQRFDVAQHAGALQWLMFAQARILAGEKVLADLQEARVALQVQCIEQQKKVDIIEAHRDDCVAQFIHVEAGKQASEADRDWLSRQPLARDIRGLSSGEMS